MIKTSTLTLILAIFGLCSCEKTTNTKAEDKPQQEEINKTDKTAENTIKEEEKDTSETVKTIPKDKNSEIIKSPCLVMVEADEQTQKQAIEKLKKDPKYNPEDMAEAGSDVGFYTLQAEDFAKTQGLKFIRTTKKTLKFYKENKMIFEYKNRITGLNNQFLFFDAKNAPKPIKEYVLLADGKEYEAYFGKKAKPVKKQN